MKTEMKLSGKAVGHRSRKPQRKVQHPGMDEEASPQIRERYKVSNHAELPRHWSDNHNKIRKAQLFQDLGDGPRFGKAIR